MLKQRELHDLSILAFSQPEIFAYIVFITKQGEVLFSSKLTLTKNSHLNFPFLHNTKRCKDVVAEGAWSGLQTTVLVRNCFYWVLTSQCGREHIYDMIDFLQAESDIASLIWRLTPLHCAMCCVSMERDRSFPYDPGEVLTLTPAFTNNPSQIIHLLIVRAISLRCW